jgi:PAS domain-containing protein
MQPILEDAEVKSSSAGRDDVNDDANSELSSVASFGRQITEFSDIQCKSMIDVQCGGFQSRGSEFWMRQCTAPVNQQNLQCRSVLLRQLSCPPDVTPTPGSVLRQESGHGSGVGNRLQPIESNASSGQFLDDVSEGVIENAIFTMVTEREFSVAVADPNSLDSYLIAVSEGFVQLTGYEREDVLGENCRLLNANCPEMLAEERKRLVNTCETGAPYTGVVINRRKSGELFYNFLDLRGLALFRNGKSDQVIWVLMCVQKDVTGLGKDELPHDHLPFLNQVAGSIRKKLVRHLAELGLSSVISRTDKGGWYLAPDGDWLPGELRSLSVLQSEYARLPPVDPSIDASSVVASKSPSAGSEKAQVLSPKLLICSTVALFGVLVTVQVLRHRRR